jgi:hypothetical protein
MITASLTDINIDKDLSHVRVKPFLKKHKPRLGKFRSTEQGNKSGTDGKRTF